MEIYRDELQNLHHRRVKYIVLGGCFITLLFGLMDFLSMPERYLALWSYRVAVVLFGLLLFYINSRDKDKRYPLWIGFAGYLSTTLMMLIMIHQMGGVSSPHFVGLIVTFTLYVTLAPLTLRQTLICGLLLVVGYLLTIMLSHSLDDRLLTLYSNLFFIICFIFIVSTQSWADTQARKKEFTLRAEEAALADELSGQAVVLENEVEKRSGEKKELEARYRLLFNQIADDVVVISPAGKILQSNDAFDSRCARAASAVGMSFFDVTLESERSGVQQLFADIIESGRPVSAGRLSLVERDGTVTEVEVNSNILKRKGKAEGIILILRDLTVRKKMEKRLLETLEIKKQTETSAILVLAKLSEFKDLTPAFHLERIRDYCRLLSIELAGYGELTDVMTPTYIEDIYHASILHDIGKVAIPDEYMAGDAPLEEYEKDVFRRHTLIGGDLIKEMEEESEGSGFLSMAKHIAYFHHERWDGKGYPYGLAEREIPLAARIMALADAYDDMTTAVAGEEEPESHLDAVSTIEANNGTWFDPMVVRAFLARQEEFEDVQRKFPYTAVNGRNGLGNREEPFC